MNDFEIKILIFFKLLHPLGENSPIANFLAKNKNGGIHHICIEVCCIDMFKFIVGSLIILF